MENVPRRYDRGVAVATFARVFSSSPHMGASDKPWKAAEVASADIAGPKLIEILHLPVYPTILVREVCTLEGSMGFFLAAEKPAAPAFDVAGAVIKRFYPTGEAPSKAVHEIHDGLCMLLSCVGRPLGEDAVDERAWGRFGRGLGGGARKDRLALLNLCQRWSGREVVKVHDHPGSTWAWSTDGLQNKRVEFAFAGVTGNGIGELGTEDFLAIHDLRDASSSTSWALDNVFHCLPAPIQGLTRQRFGDFVVEHCNQGFPAAPATSSGSLNKIVEAKGRLQEDDSIHSSIIDAMDQGSRGNNPSGRVVAQEP